jgi:hypothetical protein
MRDRGRRHLDRSPLCVADVAVALRINLPGLRGLPPGPSSIHWNWACDTLTQHAAYLSASPVIGQTELGSPPCSVGIATATRVLWRLFPVQADSQVAGSLVRLSVFKSSELEALAITSVSEGHRTLPATLINAFAATL